MSEFLHPHRVAYFNRVRPTYIENWPAELSRLSIAQVDVPLSLEETANLLDMVGDWESAEKRGSWILPRLDDAVSKFPDGAFVRLGSRSPKDSFAFYRSGGKCLSGLQSLIALVDSERVMQDLSLAEDNGYAAHVFLRQWINLEPWQELRCFMRGRRLVGISQYNYLNKDRFPELAERAGSVEWAVRDLFFPRFRDASHLDDVIFDVFLLRKTSGNEVAWEVKILEVNPMFEMTDPCLFSWANGGDFDGSFRYFK